jgi:hypothetical protein
MTAQDLRVTENSQKKIMEVLHSLFKGQQELREKVERMEEIMDQLIIHEKIENLEKEKASLLAEMKGLKEKGEVRADKLVNEVADLKEEVEALRKLLRASQEKKGSLQ